MGSRLRSAAALLAGVLVAGACAGPGAGGGPSAHPPPEPSHRRSGTSTGTGVPAAGPCADVAGPSVTGAVLDDALREVSGVASSERGVLWAHNDSGHEPVVYALDSTGAVRGRVTLPVDNIDWEDVARGPRDADSHFIYVADTGDNRSVRQSVDLYRFAEPAPADRRLGADDVDRLQLTYEGGPVDVEALFVDPVTGDAYLIGKPTFGDAPIFVIPESAWSSGSHEAARAGTVDLGLADFVTAADISPDGGTIAVRTYTRVLLWSRPEGVTPPAAMAADPCDLIPPEEPQGEAITITDRHIYTIGEGAGAPVHRYTLGR